MRGIYICDIQRRTTAEYAEVSARVEGLPAGLGEERLWFRFPAGLASWFSDGSEPMVAALLPLTMLLKRPLRVEGHISPLFYSGCQQIVRLYHAWDRRLGAIELDVAVAPAAPRAPKANACFFTGGVDSFYTLLKNLEREHGDSRISHLIFIREHADGPPERRLVFENQAAKLRKVASAFHLGLVLADTNLKSFTPLPGAPWDWNAGSRLAAAGLCLGGELRRLFVPSGDTYSTLSPWGSHPLVDPLWSTESLEFRHDGCEAFRSQKLEWRIIRSPVALENLTVCGYDATGLRNCGTCEKCLRTMIGLTALGAEAPPELFAAPLDLKRIRQLDGGDRVIGYYLRDNLRLLAASRHLPELESAVRHALRPSAKRWLQRHFQNGVREIDRRYLRARGRSWAIAQAGQNSLSQSDLRRAPTKWVLQQAWRLITKSPAGNRGRNAEKERMPEPGSSR